MSICQWMSSYHSDIKSSPYLSYPGKKPVQNLNIWNKMSVAKWYIMPKLNFYFLKLSIWTLVNWPAIRVEWQAITGKLYNQGWNFKWSGGPC